MFPVQNTIYMSISLAIAYIRRVVDPSPRDKDKPVNHGLVAVQVVVRSARAKQVDEHQNCIPNTQLNGYVGSASRKDKTKVKQSDEDT